MSDEESSFRSRLSAARKAHDRPSRRGGSGGKAGVALGMRAAFEMVLAPLVGGGLGWLIDSATGTSPAFILIGGVLGMIAGVVNATRLAARHVADETRT